MGELTCMGLAAVLNVKAVVAAFNQEMALVGAFSVITNRWMELFEALVNHRSSPHTRAAIIIKRKMHSSPASRHQQQPGSCESLCTVFAPIHHILQVK